jgi:hypothetical protein
VASQRNQQPRGGMRPPTILRHQERPSACRTVWRSVCRRISIPVRFLDPMAVEHALKVVVLLAVGAKRSPYCAPPRFPASRACFPYLKRECCRRAFALNP